ncbi:hypothetical protein L484_024269 [Morus notabilis]|uniref:Uncharacterized protein n=1 Tax=Morus notabilis TaxID=981085 RepID=W9QS74_9ROSA|nr:hypothetical protein L484_024269 [Morus notabilis]
MNFGQRRKDYNIEEADGHGQKRSTTCQSRSEDKHVNEGLEGRKLLGVGLEYLVKSGELSIVCRINRSCRVS